MEFLIKWKTVINRKPLILFGARQTGKTWLLKEFARQEYRQSVYINFDDNPEMGEYFQKNLDTKRIITALSYHYKIEINPADTLIIFDEIQECQRAKDFLKYITENAPEYHVAAAGSFLGVATGKFPVGKIDRLTLYPLTYYEFLEAINRNDLVKAIKNSEYKLLESMAQIFIDMLRIYFYIGGMPAAVAEYLKSQNLGEVKRIQNAILKDYKDDFSKHIKASDIPKVRLLWDSIQVHLAREKKKFIYRDIKSGGRASEFENAMNWLINTGLVYKVPRVLNPQIPLSSDEERESFKLFLLDTGLLCAKTNVDISSFYAGNREIFSDFNGALAEQYVCQELTAAMESPLYYWGRDKGMAEIDFLLQHQNEIIPVEVKSAYNKRSLSLDVYLDLVKPKIAVRTSLRNLGVISRCCSDDGRLFSVPLYMIGSLAEIIDNGRGWIAAKTI